MVKWLLDSNIVSHVIRFPDGAAAHRLSAHRVDCGLSIFVAAETRFGIRKKPSSRGAGRAKSFLEEFDIIPFEPPGDDHYGRVRAYLEAKGTPIGSNDLFIAAHALALDATLVTANEREFRRVPGLRVENWTV